MIGLLLLPLRLPFLIIRWLFTPFWRPTSELELRRIRKELERANKKV